MSAREWCHLAAPTAANPGARCARLAGHVGPGLFCTSDPHQAGVRDRRDQEIEEAEADGDIFRSR